MNMSIRTLLNFLVERGFEPPSGQAISAKVLTRPSVKDFREIIEFLFQQLDSNFSFGERFEDDVVVMFKHLGYPTAISKSNIAAVGSPHAWPSIMAAVMWLIELLHYDDTCASNPAADDTEDLSDKAFYSYLAESYGLFLQGDDEQHSILEQDFQDALDRKNAALMEQTEHFESSNNQLRMAIAAAENRSATIPELEDKKAAYISDLGKFEGLIEQLEKHKTQLHQKTQDREAELERLTTSVAAVKEELGALSQRVNSQELSADDVEKLVAERERLEEQFKHASGNRQAVQHKVWESEMKLRDSVQALEDSSRAYNSIAEDLKLVPATARNANGRNLALVVDTRAKSGSGLLKTDIASDIVPHLLSLKEELDRTTHSFRDETLKQQESQEEMEQARADCEDQKEMAHGKIRKAEEAYKREKEALDELLNMNAQEVEDMEQRLLQMRDTAHEEARASAAARKVSEIKASNEALRAEHERTKQEIIAAIMDVVGSCAAHRELVRSRLDHIKGKYAEQLQHQLDFAEKFDGFSVQPPRPPAMA
jgi:kinetochore protein NDC80